MLDNIFNIKETVDIFVSQTESPDKVLIIFHKMTTRDRIELLAGKVVAEFLALMNGKDSARIILQKLGVFGEESAESLLNFLKSQHLIVEANEEKYHNIRYKRHISYFDDMVMERSGEETQKLLESKKIVIFGCGAVGAAIAEILVRSGILNFVLIDYKIVTNKSINRQIYLSKKDLNKSKVEALSDFINCINGKAHVVTFCEMLLPQSDLIKWIPADADLVINTCDEPYIGHTSIKIGRHLSERKIPFYVAGGFDAHLMSSGELIFPPLTPCIDCAQRTFTKALGSWRPTYSEIKNEKNVEELSEFTLSNYVSGGAGGLAVMSGFSANLGALNILQFLIEDPLFDFNIKRYEYLVNSGVMTEFAMEKQGDCDVCNN